MKALSILTVLILSIIGSRLYAQTLTGSLSNGLIAVYKFDGNANDSSGNGRNLNLNYDTYVVSGGLTGGALDLSQSSHSRADYLGQSTNLTSNFTMSFWIKLSTTGRNNPEWIYLLQSAGTTGDTFLRIGTVVGSTEKNVGFTYTGPDVTIPLIQSNQWFNITAVQNGNVDSIYFNGLLATNKTVDVASPLDQNNYIIGNSGGYQYSVPGQLDGVVLYNRALSAEEVLALYNSQRPIYEVTLTTKSSTNLNEWTGFLTNKVETYNPAEFYKHDISVTIKPPAQ